MFERPSDCRSCDGGKDEEGVVDGEGSGADAWQSVLLVYVGKDGHVTAEGGEKQEEESAQPDRLLPRSHYIYIYY